MNYYHIIHIELGWKDTVVLTSKLDLSPETVTLPLHGNQPSKVASAFLKAKGFNIIGYAAGYEGMIISDTIKPLK